MLLFETLPVLNAVHRPLGSGVPFGHVKVGKGILASHFVDSDRDDGQLLDSGGYPFACHHVGQSSSDQLITIVCTIR
jgi:hypothetical protein